MGGDLLLQDQRGRHPHPLGAGLDRGEVAQYSVRQSRSFACVPGGYIGPQSKNGRVSRHGEAIDRGAAAAGYELISDCGRTHAPPYSHGAPGTLVSCYGQKHTRIAARVAL